MDFLRKIFLKMEKFPREKSIFAKKNVKKSLFMHFDALAKIPL